MFLVFNKQKIYSYLVALSTVVVLFIIAATLGNRTVEDNNKVVQSDENQNYISCSK